MNIPGFGATASLYNASTYYCLANAWPSVAGTHSRCMGPNAASGHQPAGIIHRCGDCYWSHGECVMDCTTCLSLS